MQQNLPSLRITQDFDNLTYNRKVYFTTKYIPELRSSVFIPEFSNMEEVGDPYKKGHIFYKYLVTKFS